MANTIKRFRPAAVVKGVTVRNGMTNPVRAHCDVVQPDDAANRQIRDQVQLMFPK